MLRISCFDVKYFPSIFKSSGWILDLFNKYSRPRLIKIYVCFAFCAKKCVFVLPLYGIPTAVDSRIGLQRQCAAAAAVIHLCLSIVAIVVRSS